VGLSLKRGTASISTADREPPAGPLRFPLLLDAREMADPLTAFVSELDPAAEPAAGGSESITSITTGTDRAPGGFRYTRLHAAIWLLMALSLA
jgi:hypothetical protein